MGTTITRRQFATGSAAGACAAIAAAAPAVAAEPEQEAWDEEVELVVAGSGTGIFAALAAKAEGRSAVLLEKSGVIGGTMTLSGGAFWVPCNAQELDGMDPDDTPEKAVAYMMATDIYGSADEALCLDFARNVETARVYVEEKLDIPWTGGPMWDYNAFEGTGLGRTIHGDVTTPEWRDRMEQELEGIVRFNTALAELVTDEDGSVIGVVAESADGTRTRIRATGGVLLATGGFDHNEYMREAYLRSPLYGTVLVAGDTGDGHRMGMALGADIKKMSALYATVAYIKDGEEGEMSVDPTAFDHFCFRILPHTMIVNRHGRRFMDETQSYDYVGLALSNIDAHGAGAYTEGPAFLICDQQVVDQYGYPGRYRLADELIGLEKPDFVHEYATLQELAEGEGIDEERFLEEVERFNGFCDEGVDRDFGRGEAACAWEMGLNYYLQTPDETLPCFSLGKVEEGPFYAVKVGIGSFGTSGGLVVDEHARVLRDGEPISGLYATGCVAAAYAGYQGGGTSNASGMYRSLRAADDALGLGIF